MKDWTTGDPRLLLTACRACGTTRYLPRETCPSCGSRDANVLEAAGTGRCVAATRVHVGVTDGPVDLVLVELDEDAVVMGRTAGPVEPGDLVRADFVRHGDALVPIFSRESNT
ncbi:Zn-ribbon domain-containing OB-fold protein [Amycolatopsis sacchari]|uniref:Zn-ribbon domain-containing OB-fold protein n=1 Tax=Amycolatopsis sacchari TaxID=115433 RepID=UPI003EB7FC17